MNHRITIKDIAEKAGVSRGTVDRVLHKRGKVAPDVKKRVMEVIDELGYEKNIFASTLAYNKTFRIAILLPNPENDPYWQQPNEGIHRAYESFKHFGIAIETYYFYLFDAESFCKKSIEVLEASPDAILLAPIFLQEAIDFMQACQKDKIPVAIINTNIAAEKALCYIGQDSYQSGVLAARLLNFGLNPSETAMVLNLGPVSSNAQHLVDKETGFRTYFSQIKEKNINVISCEFEAFDDSPLLRKFFLEKLKKHPNLAGVFVNNSRAYKLVNSLDDDIVDKIKIVGFDLLKVNLDYLFVGKINFLINQNPVHQGYLGIVNIVNHLIHKKEIKQIQHLPLDIVVSENATYYLKRQEAVPILI